MNALETSIAFTNVSIAFGDRQLLRSIDFEFSSACSYAVLGPSGSGKTTLLALAGGLVRPTTGTVGYRRNETVVPARQVSTAWVTQTTNSIGSRTALENVAIGLVGRVGKWQKALQGANEMLESLGMVHLAKRRCRELSGGELQRIVVGRALVGQPDFLLADEPTGQLDRKTSLVVADSIVSRRGETGLVVATHDEAVAQACEVVLAISNGRLVMARGS